MANNIRTTLLLEENSVFVFEDIFDAEFYKFKLIRKDCPSVTIWEIIKRKTDLKKTGELLEFEIPEGVPTIKELISYSLLGEADCKDGVIQAQCDFILLESETRQAYKELKDEISKSLDKNLIKLFGEFSNYQTMGPRLFSTSSGSAGWNFGRPCPWFQFSFVKKYPE
jgi:hypothetical protein